MKEKEYETKDEHEEHDAAFLEAHNAFTRFALGHQVDEETINNAAEILTEYALKNGDRFALAAFIVSFSDFIDVGKAPPMPMLKGLRDVLEKYRCETRSMDKAFSLHKTSKGRPSRAIVQREWSRTNASLVIHWMSEGDTLEVAIEETVYFRTAGGKWKGDSEAKIKRDYLKYRKIKKII